MLIIAAILLVVWAGLEIQNNGLEGAFNGFFAPAGQKEAEVITSTPQRAGNSVRKAFQAGEERNNRLLDEHAE